MNKSLELIHTLRQSLDDENISWGELAQIDSLADELGITTTSEMMASDTLDEIEDKIRQMGESE